MLRLKTPPLSLVLLFSYTEAIANMDAFDTRFLKGNARHAALSHITLSPDAPYPGEYPLDVQVNGEWRGQYTLTIDQQPDNTCLSATQLHSLGIKLPTPPFDTNCITLRQALHGGSYRFDTGLLQLNLTLPQAFVISKEKGYITPEGWDRGINAFFTSYNASYYYSDYRGNGHSRNTYLNLNSGLNLLGWQLRAATSYNQRDGQRGDWSSNSAYLQRSFAPIHGVLRLGDMYSATDLFAGVRFRGVRLFSELRMLPNSKQHFTPLVRGVAQSNALVTVEQNDVIVYRQEVPPGPFSIEDLQLVGGGADLNVSVQEADGRVTRFIVPYSALPNMLQPGVGKYDLAAGQTYLPNIDDQRGFFQGSYQHGLNSLLTLYGGVQASQDYYALLLGNGLNTRLGAFSLDITHSASRLADRDEQYGQSYQLAYNKYLATTATHFSLAAYRYSSRHYRTLSDHLYLNDKRADPVSAWDHYRYDPGRKNNFTLNLNQTLADGWGSLFISGTWRDYWGSHERRQDYQVSYSNNWQQLNYTLAASQTYDQGMNSDRRFYLYFTLPLNVGEPRRPLYLSNATTIDRNGYQSNTTTLSGSAGEWQQLNYGFNLNNQRSDRLTALGGNLSYKARSATLNASYSQSQDYRQSSAGISGGIVAYRGGVLFSNTLTDTMAIVDAPGLRAASVNGYGYHTTNSAGQALYAALTPYRENSLRLTPSAQDDTVALKSNMQKRAPYQGAVVLARFETDTRQHFYFRAQRADGAPLNFGYPVNGRDGEPLGLVGQGGMISLRSDALPAQVTVPLDTQTGDRCTITLSAATLSSQTHLCR
ncbi:fimbria/pilus outer membrane usher protein [Edwardsiella hoshinae]|uniref:Heat shock protein E n=1 Tax=Edwardsiella hoshinae TaxID=93378 RepID=A0A376DDF6_9GAMM|nr:fimbrial biogenesis outer membrane usher protein [Edwardsiella hoshinae]QPR27578.1 fimbria/pilus outer membrane usher protein [Edwardsiella hoshinae]STC86788.1 Heat shock protein E [Edwardsiella hoshinae]